MMSTYALIEDGIVLNVILWDGKDGWVPPEGTSAVELTADSPVGIGWTHENDTFSAPVTTQPLPS